VLAGVAIGAIVLVLETVVALPWLSAKDAPLPSVRDLLELAAGVLAYAGLAAAFGAGLGALLRNQVAAIVIVLVTIFVVDPTITALSEPAGAYTLTGLGASISGVDDASNLLSPVAAALVWTGYTLLFVTLAAIRTAKRDI
jgi:hypothetical protein